MLQQAMLILLGDRKWDEVTERSQLQEKIAFALFKAQSSAAQDSSNKGYTKEQVKQMSDVIFNMERTQDPTKIYFSCFFIVAGMELRFVPVFKTCDGMQEVFATVDALTDPAKGVFKGWEDFHQNYIQEAQDFLCFPQQGEYSRDTNKQVCLQFYPKITFGLEKTETVQKQDDKMELRQIEIVTECSISTLMKSDHKYGVVMETADTRENLHAVLGKERLGPLDIVAFHLE